MLFIHIEQLMKQVVNNINWTAEAKGIDDTKLKQKEI